MRFAGARPRGAEPSIPSTAPLVSPPLARRSVRLPCDRDEKESDNETQRRPSPRLHACRSDDHGGHRCHPGRDRPARLHRHDPARKAGGRDGPARRLPLPAGEVVPRQPHLPDGPAAGHSLRHPEPGAGCRRPLPAHLRRPDRHDLHGHRDGPCRGRHGPSFVLYRQPGQRTSLDRAVADGRAALVAGRCARTAAANEARPSPVA